MPMMPVMKPPMRNEIRRGQRWAKSLAGLTTLAAMFVASVAMQSDEHRHDQHDRILELARAERPGPKDSSWSVGQVLVDHERGRRDGDADEREQAHRRRQAERLAEHLVALRAGVAAEVGNVERQRGPEADVGGERREEERPELARLRLPAANCDGCESMSPKPPAAIIGPGQAAPGPARSAAAL